MKSIYLFTNIAPHYRKKLWNNLLALRSNTFHFFYGDNPSLKIQNIKFSEQELLSFKKQLHVLKNCWYRGKVLVWQKGVISQCMKGKFQIVIFLGEMYCISTWLAAIICRIRGKKVIFWGHGIYGNEGILKLFIRNKFYRLAHKHLLYERRAKQLMVKQGFIPENLFVIFNSLDYDEHLRLRDEFSKLNKTEVLNFFSNTELPVLVFIGRLTAVKKLDMLFEVVKRLNQQNETVNLLIIGDGPEREMLKMLGKEGLQKKWIHFTGASYDEEEIGKYLAVSDLCVSPGNVGLTAIHSLSFGTPVCTHDNMKNQMPEAETIIEGFNGFFFYENDTTDLTYKINSWLKNNKDRIKVRKQCYEVIDKYYNPNYQLTVINRLINNEIPEI